MKERCVTTIPWRFGRWRVGTVARRILKRTTTDKKGSLAAGEGFEPGEGFFAVFAVVAAE